MDEFERDGTGRCAEDSTSSRFMVVSWTVSPCAGSAVSVGSSSSSRARFLPLLFSPLVLLAEEVGLLSAWSMTRSCLRLVLLVFVMRALCGRTVAAASTCAALKVAWRGLLATAGVACALLTTLRFGGAGAAAFAFVTFFAGSAAGVLLGVSFAALPLLLAWRSIPVAPATLSTFLLLTGSPLVEMPNPAADAAAAAAAAAAAFPLATFAVVFFGLSSNSESICSLCLPLPAFSLPVSLVASRLAARISVSCTALAAAAKWFVSATSRRFLSLAAGGRGFTFSLLSL